MKFICPKCSSPLTVTESGSAVCKNRHSFDRSREGYYNLLLTNAGGTHGDNAEMIKARRRFLDTGAYLPLAKAIAETVASGLSSFDANTPRALLDVGCGEGYYTSVIAESLLACEIKCDIYGFDISKDATRLAAKRNKNATFSVASAYNMPVADSSFDVITNVFSPLAIDETLRALRPHGRFVMAIPTERHLYGLKEKIYATPYENEVLDFKLDGLTLLSSRRIEYTLDLDTPEKIRDLFMMTPYAYRTGRAERERLEALTALTTEVGFVLLEYEKA